jgi:hypothetical protein
MSIKEDYQIIGSVKARGQQPGLMAENTVTF